MPSGNSIPRAGGSGGCNPIAVRRSGGFRVLRRNPAGGSGDSESAGRIPNCRHEASGAVHRIPVNRCGGSGWMRQIFRSQTGGSGTGNGFCFSTVGDLDPEIPFRNWRAGESGTTIGELFFRLAVSYQKIWLRNFRHRGSESEKPFSIRRVGDSHPERLFLIHRLPHPMPENRPGFTVGETLTRKNDSGNGTPESPCRINDSGIGGSETPNWKSDSGWTAPDSPTRKNHSGF